MIGVIDYGMGNLRSVMNAIEHVGFQGQLVDEPGHLDDCDHLVVPGVGAFPKAMENLHARGLVVPIRAYAAAGRPLLGICLGMQVLATTGYESDRCEGLDLISGDVTLLPVKQATALPHVGWNSVTLVREHPVFAGVRRDVDFYFVHSYAFKPTHTDALLGVTDYDGPFAAAVGQGSVLGLQFHPEKSQVAGLRLLEQFCRWDGLC